MRSYHPFTPEEDAIIIEHYQRGEGPRTIIRAFAAIGIERPRTTVQARWKNVLQPALTGIAYRRNYKTVADSGTTWKAATTVSEVHAESAKEREMRLAFAAAARSALEFAEKSIADGWNEVRQARLDKARADYEKFCKEEVEP